MIDIQICHEYIDTKVLLNLNRVSVQIKTYLMNNLSFNFIININVLNKKNINFLLTRQALKIKNIEISLCYVSSSSMKINNYDYYIFYHFITYTNSHNIISSNIRK